MYYVAYYCYRYFYKYVKIIIIERIYLMYEFDSFCRGSAIAQTLGYFTMFLLSLIYILVSGMYKATWGGKIYKK